MVPPAGWLFATVVIVLLLAILLIADGKLHL